MAETRADLEQQVEHIIRTRFAQEPAEQEDTPTEHTTEQQRVIDVDLYRLQGGAVLLVPTIGTSLLDAHSVESEIPATSQEEPASESPTLPFAQEEEQEALPQHHEPEEKQGGARKRTGSVAVFLVPLVLLCVLAAGEASSLYLLPLLATATVTITPQARSLHMETTLTIAAHPKAGQVQGRSLIQSRLTKSLIVPATGRAHDDARAATGVLTFYNADVSPSTIPAGTSFTVQGVTVLTDAAVTVQAVVPPMLGTAFAAAHALQAGSIGNLPAHVIYARCCGSPFVTATNTSAFSGGQDARSYSYIQSSDIHAAATDLVQRVTPQATAQLQQQIRAGEQLVTPLCSPRTQQSAERLTNKRNRRIDHYLHTASKRVIDLLVKESISTLVIGKNDGWKQEANLGKRNNQHFVQLPHARFIQMLTYKAELVGIRVKVTEESYTSKASLLDLDPLPVRNSNTDTKHNFSGKRVKRGLYRTSDVRYINADINGAGNTIRKVAPNAFGSEGVEDGNGVLASLVVHPVRIVVPRTKPKSKREVAKVSGH